MLSTDKRLILWPGKDRNHIRDIIRFAHYNVISGIITEDSQALPYGLERFSLQHALSLKSTDIIVYGKSEEIVNRFNEVRGGARLIPYFLLRNDIIRYTDLKDFDISVLSDIISHLKTDKKIAVLIGNCQLSYLSSILSSQKEFYENYCIIDIPKIFEKFESVDLNKIDLIIKNADLILSQPIREDNKFLPYYSNKNIYDIKNKNCTFILIPNITFAGYWPQMKNFDKSLKPSFITLGGQKIFPYVDYNILTMLDKGYSDQEILLQIKSIDFYSASEVLDHYSSELSISFERESNCDIKIFDYVSKIASEDVIFYSFNHPKAIVIEELAKRIFSAICKSSLSLPEIEKKRCEYNLFLQSQYIYPSVEVAITSKYFERSYYSNKYAFPMVMNGDEYIQTYINSIRLKNAGVAF